MSHRPTVAGLRAAGVAVAATMLFAPTVQALPMVEASAEPMPTPIHLPTDSLFEPAGDSAETAVAAFAEAAEQPTSENAYLVVEPAWREGQPQSAKSVFLPGWAPGDFPESYPAGRGDDPLFNLPVSELLALPDVSLLDTLPEPGTTALIGSGLIGMALMIRRRNRPPRRMHHPGDLQ